MLPLATRKPDLDLRSRSVSKRSLLKIRINTLGSSGLPAKPNALRRARDSKRHAHRRVPLYYRKALRTASPSKAHMVEFPSILAMKPPQGIIVSQSLSDHIDPSANRIFSWQDRFCRTFQNGVALPMLDPLPQSKATGTTTESKGRLFRRVTRRLHVGAARHGLRARRKQRSIKWRHRE